MRTMVRHAAQSSGRRNATEESAELMHNLVSSGCKKDVLIETLRSTLGNARQELERSRARAERARVTEDLVKGLRHEVRQTQRRCDEERRAFAKREEAWATRCEDLERLVAAEKGAAAEGGAAKAGLERRLRALGEELKKSLDGHAEAERRLRAEADARRNDAAVLRAEAVDALRGRGEVDERLAGVAMVAEQQKELLSTKEKLRCDAERARAQLQGENLELRRSVAEMQTQLLSGQRHEREHVAPLEVELGRAREQVRELKHHAKLREKQFEEMLRAADGVKDEVTQLRGRLTTYDALADRAADLDGANREYEERCAHLATQLERERSERAQWARARIELLTQFCDSSASAAVGISDTASAGRNADEAMLRLLHSAGEPSPQPAPLFPPSPHHRATSFATGGAYANAPPSPSRQSPHSPSRSVASAGRRFD